MVTLIACVKVEIFYCALRLINGQNNVLLDADYTACLGDFGYASLVGNIPEALTYLQRSTARPGALRWTAPEQVDPEETFNKTTKTDVYSFGCVSLQGSPVTDPRRHPHIDILAGFVRQRTMVGSPGRLSHCVALGEGGQAWQTKVSNNAQFTLEFNSRLLVSNREAPCCGGDNIYHQTVLETLPTVPSAL